MSGVGTRLKQGYLADQSSDINTEKAKVSPGRLSHCVSVARAFFKTSPRMAKNGTKKRKVKKDERRERARLDEKHAGANYAACAFRLCGF